MLIFALGLIAYPAAKFGCEQINHLLRRREAIAEVRAWYRTAQTFVVPEGSLLYSEPRVDFATSSTGIERLPPWGRWKMETTYLTAKWPILGFVQEYHGVPTIWQNGTLFVHERSMCVDDRGVRPMVICVRYYGMTDGKPSFNTQAIWQGGWRDDAAFPSVFGVNAVAEVPSRPLTNLRIYAGRAGPVDLTRFTLPFDCDGGKGRFEFKTDDDVTDGGKPAPDVWIEWDDSPATQPATRSIPPSPDAASPHD